MSLPVPLSTLTAGVIATVQELRGQGAAPIRLREMGLLPGTRLTLMRIAPLGDPIEIKIRGYNLTLRKVEADQVMVILD